MHYLLSENRVFAKISNFGQYIGGMVSWHQLLPILFVNRSAILNRSTWGKTINTLQKFWFISALEIFKVWISPKITYCHTGDCLTTFVAAVWEVIFHARITRKCFGFWCCAVMYNSNEKMLCSYVLESKQLSPHYEKINIVYSAGSLNFNKPFLCDHWFRKTNEFEWIFFTSIDHYFLKKEVR